MSLELGVAVAESSASTADGMRRFVPLPDLAGEAPPTKVSAPGWLRPSDRWLSLCNETMQHLAPVPPFLNGKGATAAKLGSGSV